MKLLYTYLIFLVLISISGCSGTNTDIEHRPDKPNIVLIFIDDMGWPAIESYGNEHVKTPHVNRLADEGMKFTNAYVTPQCTPSRASLITGQHTARNKMWHVIPGYFYPYARSEEPEYKENLGHDIYTLPKALKDNGYKTAIFGKWHLTHNNDGYYTRLFDRSKEYFGFDEVDPMTNPTEYQARTDKGVDFLTDLTIDFMERNKDTTFFVYLSHHTIHGPILAPDSLTQKYLDKGYPKEGLHHAEYLAAIEHMDNAIGRLLNRMDELDLTKNTMVVFLTDNGGVDRDFDNAPLRHGKGSAYEGGIRVPFIVRWPEKINPGTINNTPVHVVDMYPTFLEVAGGQTTQSHIQDGESLIPLLTATGKLNRNTLFWYMPLYDPQWGAVPSAVIRKDNYKLIHFFHDYINKDKNLAYIPEGRIELYDLSNDISESTDLSDSLPEITRNLTHELHAWIKDMGEEIPGVNPRFNPDSVYVRTNPPRTEFEMPEH